MQKTKKNTDILKQINKIESEILSLKINYAKSREEVSKQNR
jgi:hypothetical protein